MNPRPMLDSSARTADAAKALNDFHADTVSAVSAAVAKDPVVIVGMRQNPVVKKARQALDEAGVPFTYLEYGSYLSEWKRRLAIKMWTGWPTFPQVFVKGVFIGGNKELRAAIERGDLARWIEQGPPRVEV